MLYYYGFRSMFPERYAGLVHTISVCTLSGNNCVFVSRVGPLNANYKPSFDNPALVPLIPQVPFDEEN